MTKSKSKDGDDKVNEFDFDTAKCAAINDKLCDLLKESGLSDDNDLAVVLMAEGAMRCVRAFGPDGMPAAVGLFVKIWRQAEVTIATRVVKDFITKMALADMPVEENKPTH